jgi:tetratricopeptide (TPR) repeat protein
MKPLGDRLLTVSDSSSQRDQPLPAGAILPTAGGLLTSPGRTEGGEKLDQRPSSRRIAHLWRFALLILAGGVWTWAILGANNARVAESHWDRVIAAAHHLEKSQWYAPPQAYEYLFTNATAAVAAEPADIHYRHWLGVYKWLSLTSYMDPNTEQLRSEAVPWVRQIVEELHQARPLCPTFGPLYCIAGEIEGFSLGDPGGTERIAKGFQLAPCHPDVCFIAGRVDAEAGNADDAFEKLSRAVQLDGGYFPKVASLLIGTLDRGDLALKLAGDDAGRLASVGGLLADAGRTPQRATLGDDAVPNPDNRGQLARQAQTQAFEQLKAKCEQPDAPASAHASLANLYRQQGELDMAIRHYRRAVRLDYDQVSWHYALAQVLVQADRVEEAVHEAQICLRLRPDHAPARQMLERLSTRTVTTPRTSTTGP